MASRIDYSQNRKLYVGTTAEISVADGGVIIDNQLILGGSSSNFMLDVSSSAKIGSINTASSTTNYENVLMVAGKNNYSDGTTWYGSYGQILLSASSNMTGSSRQFLITNALDNNKFAIIRSVDASTPPVTNSTATGVNSGTADFVINNTGYIGIGTNSPAVKLDVQGDVKIIGTVVEEGIGNNKTYRYRTENSSSWSGGTKAAKFGRFYWTPAHWVNVGPAVKITIQSKYYTGVSRTYMVQAGYQDNEVIVNQLEVNDVDNRTALLVGPKTSAGYNYANQPVYYVDLSMVFSSYMWGWAQVESQVPFLTANPTTEWGGVVMDSTLTQPNTSVTFPTNYPTFVAGNLGVGTYNPSTKLQVNGIAQIVEGSNTAFYGGDYVRVFGNQNYGFRNTGGTQIANISMSGNSYFNGGNVGIGTSGPNNLLELYKTVDSGIGPILQLTNSQYTNANNSGSSIQFRGYTVWGPGSTNPRYSEINAINGSGSVPKRIEFKFYADTDVKTPLSILQTGYVGIGTTGPRDALEVVGNIRFVEGEDHLMIKPNSTIHGADFIVGDGVATTDTPVMSLNGLNGGKVTIQTQGNSVADKTVLDVQGTQGQLFSVTDDLSGSIFAVSDISGVPILDVNSSGTVTIDGDLVSKGLNFLNQSNQYNNTTPGITGYGNVSMDTSVSFYDTGKNVPTQTRGMVWTGKHYIVTRYTGPLAALFYSNNFDSITNPEASSITLPPPSSGGSNPHGAAWDGRYLYSLNYSPMKILAYDLDNGTTTATVVSETDISSYSATTYDIEYAEGHLYTCADGKVSKFKVEGKTITHVFTSGVILGTLDAQAITYDGSYLWFTQNGLNAYKVSLDCVLVATITTGLPTNNVAWAWNGQNVAAVNHSTGDVYIVNTAETRFDTEEFIVMGGNVGIGTDSPGAKLEVEGDATSDDTPQLIVASGGADNNAIIHFTDDDGGQVNAIGALEGNILTFASLNELVFKTDTSSILGNNQTRMTIDSSGDVGIGTGTPECKLHIVSTTTDNSKTLLLQNSSTGDASVMFNISGDTYSLGIDNSDSDKFKLSYGALGTNDRLVVDSSGNVSFSGRVGVGTTAAASNQLDVIGDIRGTKYLLNGNVSNPTTTTATIYDQASVGLTLSAHNLSIRNYNGSAMMESARFEHDNLTCAGDVIAYGSPSDIRLKENIKPIESALDKAIKLQGVTFDWKESDSILDIKEDIGFIAQDVQKVVPELVRENVNGMLSMRHQGIAPILLEAIKELKAEIDLLKSKPCTCNKCNCNI